MVRDMLIRNGRSCMGSEDGYFVSNVSWYATRILLRAHNDIRSAGLSMIDRCTNPPPLTPLTPTPTVLHEQ
jgi:hypothetical protein